MGYKCLNECFIESFLNQKEKKAVTFLRDGQPETELSYAALDRDSTRIANLLKDMGIEKGDRVVFLLNKSLVFVVAYIAIQKLGAVAVPLNPGFKQAELAYLLGDCNAKLVLSEPQKLNTVKAVNPKQAVLAVDSRLPYQNQDFFRSALDAMPQVELKPEDPGLIIYTSGTTGKPKGAVLTQGNLVHDAQNIIGLWEISQSDGLCHALPLFHVHGLCFALHTALIAGSQILMLDQFDPGIVIESLARNKGGSVCSVFMAVPAMYAKLLNCIGARSFDFSHMRLWTSGSAPLLVKDFERIKHAFGKKPVEREGMSETGMNFSNPLKGIRKSGSIGLPLPGLEVRIVNPKTFENMESGQEGEFWLKGPAVTPGYWQKPEETANAFVDGWFRTGDLGRVDEDGYYFLTDRIKHIIISGGENISPKEIETVINQIDDVVESSVVGIDDERWGEKVVAAVVTKSGAGIQARDVQNYCKGNLHSWKCPKEVVFVEELPKNTMGKVLKEDVEKMFKGN